MTVFGQLRPNAALGCAGQRTDGRLAYGYKKNGSEHTEFVWSYADLSANSRLYPPIVALRAFEAVARLGGIRRAARELMVDHAVVSRHIRSLEQWVGVALLDRDGNARLTPHGEVYFKEISDALTIIARASQNLLVDVGEHDLHLGCEVNFSTMWLANLLPDFIAENRDINVYVHAHVNDVDLTSKQFDCNISFLTDSEQAMLPHYIMRESLIVEESYPVATPACLAKLSVESAEDALNWPLLHAIDDQAWKLWFYAQGIAVDYSLSGMRLGQLDVMMQAAKRSQGVALGCDMAVGADIEQGKLIRIHRADGAFAPLYMGSYVFLSHEERWGALPVVRFHKWLRSKFVEHVRRSGGDVVTSCAQPPSSKVASL